MEEDPGDFDPESAKGRQIGGKAAREPSDFFSLMGHFYRGELGRTTSWRARIDRTTNWAVVLTATLLTWAFSSESRPHYVLIVGMLMVTVFLGIESRRYRIYDVWRSRVRILEENIFANALNTRGVEHSNWRELLSEDLREPTLKTPRTEAVARRLQRIYLPLLSVLVVAWVVRLTVFASSPAGVVRTAAVGGVPGYIVIGAVGLGYVALLVVTFWPWDRHAKGEFQNQSKIDEWK